MSKWLKDRVWIGTLTANALSIFTANWPLALSGVIAFSTMVSSNFLIWVKQDEVVYSTGVFLAFLWTIIGVKTLKNQTKVQIVRTSHDYTYCLICDGGWAPEFAKFPADHPSFPREEAVMLTCTFRNVGAGPLKLHIEEFRVVLNGMTCDDPPSPVVLTMARLSAKGIRCGGIKLDPAVSNYKGTATCKFLYGPPDGKFVRRYTMKAKLQLGMDRTSTPHLAVISNEVLEEKDEPY